MTRQEHKAMMLGKVYTSLCVASAKTVAHSDLAELRKKIDSLCEEVAKMIEVEENKLNK